MSAQSDFLKSALNDRVFGDSSIFAELHIGLSTTAPNDDGTNVTEPVGSAYERVQYDPGTVRWLYTGGAGTVSNLARILWIQATGSWGTLTHFVIYDASTGGNLVAHGPLSASQVVGTTDTASIEIAKLVHTWD